MFLGIIALVVMIFGIAAFFLSIYLFYQIYQSDKSGGVESVWFFLKAIILLCIGAVLLVVGLGGFGIINP